MSKFVIQDKDTLFYLKKFDNESTEWAFDLKFAKRFLGIEVVRLYKEFKVVGTKVKAIGEERA